MVPKVKRKLTILNYSSGSVIGDIIVDSLVTLLNEAGADARSESIRAAGIRDYFRGGVLKRLEVLSLLFIEILPLIQIIFIILRGVYSSREEFVSSVLGFKYKGLVVGDCIVSSFFRSPNTPVLPKLSVKFILYLLASIPQLSYQIRCLKKALSNYNAEGSLFFGFETTGFDEVARRYMVDSGYCEIRYSELHQGFRIFKGFTGIDLRKSLAYRKFFYETLSPEEISIGKNSIYELVERKVQYSYLKDNDVSTDMEIGLQSFPAKNTVILFLATLSDAQYLYGNSPFGDLHGFQEGIIKWGLSNGLNVVVKPHPGMYKEKDYTIKDRKYFEGLRKDWCISGYAENIERSTKDSRLYFVDSKLSVKELSKIFPDFLCATQHGSVAAECAYIGHLGLVAINSQFFAEDKFVAQVDSKAALEGVLRRWQNFKGLGSDGLESLSKYSYLNNVKCQPLFASRVFYKTVPENVDSAYVETWLADYLEPDPERLRERLVDEAVEFFNSQSNDFHAVICNEG